MDLRLSFDDGREDDIRLAELIKKYDLQKYTTFYIPSNCDLSPDQIIQIDRDGFEIGGHTINHPELTRVTLDVAEWEVRDNKQTLEDLIGHKITSFCYPRGRYNNEIIDIVKDAGYYEARTTDVLKVTKDFDPYKMPTSVHIYDRKEYNGDSWYLVATEMLKEKPEYFHLWAHSWELTKYDLWEGFERLLEVISENLDTK